MAVSDDNRHFLEHPSEEIDRKCLEIDVFLDRKWATTTFPIAKCQMVCLFNKGALESDPGNAALSPGFQAKLVKLVETAILAAFPL